MKKKATAILLTASLMLGQSFAYAADSGTQQGSEQTVQNTAVQAEDALETIYSVEEFGADGTDMEDDSTAFINALAVAVASEDMVTVTVPEGTYYLERSVPIYSNTHLIVDENATIINNNPDGIMLFSRHLNEDGTYCAGDETCTHGGYSQIENVTIEGGTWDANDTAGEGVNLIFQLRHGKNITIRNLICKNATDHYINVSGVDTALIENVTFADQALYQGEDPEFWGDYEVGDATRYTTIEAVHIDYLDAVGEARAYPLDGTASQNITVTGCTFDNVFAGVGTHHYSENGRNASNIVVENNIFSNILGYCVNAYGFNDLTVEGNTAVNTKSFIHAMGSSLQVRGNDISLATDVGIYFGSESTGLISANTICDIPTGICITANSTECIVEKNQIENAADNAVYVYDNSSADVNENTIINAGAAAIRANTNCVISADGNTILQPVSHGISVSDNSELSASNNSISEAGGSGIVVTDQSMLNAEYNNIVSANGNGIVAMNGVTFSVSNNTILYPVYNGISMNNGCTGFLLDNQITSAQTGILVSSECMDCTIEGNTIASAAENAVYIYDRSQALISSNNLNGAGASGVKAASGCNVTVNENVITAPGQYGITISEDSEAAIAGNEILDSVSYGIVATGQVSITASGNRIANAGTVGIYINECLSAVIEGNTITEPQTNGINIYSTDGALVSENTVTDAGKIGIYIYGSQKCTVSCNVVEDSIQHGILAIGTVDKACSVEIIGNTSISTFAGYPDIMLGNYCVESVVNDNMVGDRGFSAVAAAEYTASNNTTMKDIDITVCSVSLSQTNFDYDGTAKEPVVTVKNSSIILKEGEDYTVTYENNVELGTATVIISGLGYYIGAVEKTFAIKLATPQIRSLMNNGGIEIAWEAVPGADGYYVYRRTEDGTWAGVTNTGDGTVTSYVDTKVTVGTTYYYTVRAYYCDENGSIVNGTYDTVGQSIEAGIPTVTIGKVTTSAGKNTVTWTIVDGADGYVVYRRTEGGKWATLARVAGGDVGTYTDNSTELTAGNVYYYTVRAYCLNGSTYTYGGYDTTGKSVTASLAAAVLVSAASVSGQNVITWKTVNGADGYTIYRKTIGGSWSGVGTVEDGQAASFTDSKGLSVGTTYIYTVRAYRLIDGTVTYASFDTEGISVVAAMPVVTLRNAVSSAGKNIITWTPISGVDGYVVYRKTANSGWTTLARVAGADTASYSDSSSTLVTGTVYTYTVRAYCLNNGTYTYGGYDTTGVSVEMGVTIPVLTGGVSDAGRNTVTWQAVNGADGYVIYRRTAEGSWSVAGTVIGQGTVSFTDSSGLSADTVYYYTVRPYQEVNGTRVYGGYDTTGIAVKTSIATVVLQKASTLAGTNSITWTRVPGVTGYVVYRKTAGGSWQTLARVTGETAVSYTDTSELMPGTEYYYTVRGYILTNKTYTYGGYDTVGKSVVTGLPSVVLVSAVAEEGKNTISWNAVTGADGYVIYRKTASGSWTVSAIVEGAQVSSYEDTKNLVTDTEYYYTVRAYMIQNGLKVYGSYDTNGIPAQ